MKTYLMKAYLSVFLISAIAAGRAQAEEFEAKQVPANVQWFLHLDVGAGSLLHVLDLPTLSATRECKSSALPLMESNLETPEI